VKELCNNYVDVLKATGHGTSQHLRKQALNSWEGMHFYMAPICKSIHQTDATFDAQFIDRTIILQQGKLNIYGHGTLIFTLKPTAALSNEMNHFREGFYRLELCLSEQRSWHTRTANSGAMDWLIFSPYGNLGPFSSY
jgi:hypothetical protein